MEYQKRKMDSWLLSWKSREHNPLLLKGARQVGKTETLKHFGSSQYASMVYVNFALQKGASAILQGGYEVDEIIKRITLIDTRAKFIPGETLLVLDEVQEVPDVMTAFKSFKLDGRFDVIASGSLLGVHYRKIHSISVGYQEEVEMHPMDFEEFLWARGRGSDIIEGIYANMRSLTPYGQLELHVYGDLFMEYCIVGGMPAVVGAFVHDGDYGTVQRLQRGIIALYREDARKYCEGLDQAKIIEVYDSVPSQLARENKKFRYAGVRKGGSVRDYAGCLQWLEDAGMVKRAYCLHFPELPIKGNVDTGIFKVYYPDSGLLLAALDDEAAFDFRVNRNFHTYRGGVVECIVAAALVNADKTLCYYKKENSTLELDFLLRTADALVPIEVKSSNNNAKSMKTALASESYPDVKFGVKLVSGNLGYSNSVYTFPHFCVSLLPRFLAEDATGPIKPCEWI